METTEYPAIATRLTRCFPELGGFAVVEPARLDAFYVGNAHDRDLLEHFVSTADGDRVAAEGIVLPLLGIAPGYYDVILRSADEPSAIKRARVTSRGWVLGSSTGKLLVCGVGYLKRWQPSHPRHERVTITPGWYEVEVRGATIAADDCDGLIELVLRPAHVRPAFTADLSRELDLGN